MPVGRVPTAKLLFLPVLVLCAAGLSFAQSNANRGRNNPYSANPSSNVRRDDPVTDVKVAVEDVAVVNPLTAFRQAVNVPKTPIPRSRPPTELYLLGIGDVLVINLKNTTNASGYYTVGPNGSIDFPLAGPPIPAVGQTTGELADAIAAAITLYRDPLVEVKIREYASHNVVVTGLVERPGPISIQREAVPVYVLRAAVGADSRATKLLIRRSDPAKIETLDLLQTATDNILIFPGNSVEFTAEGRASLAAAAGYVYIAGAVNSPGQKEFVAGMTLLQGIIASGGMKGSPKKASVRRRTNSGTLNLAEYNLRSIKDGKISDPALAPGDMIEVGN